LNGYKNIIILKVTGMLDWQIIDFAHLNKQQLHDIYQLRNQVFIVEQDCNYLDIDGKDLSAWHVLGQSQETHALIAYARIIPPQGSAPLSFGRVAVSKAYRQRGFAKELVTQIMQFVNQHPHWHHYPIHIDAQSYLVDFYQGFGFGCQSETYLLDGIPHVKMAFEPA
jgi:ElaA protein